MASKYVKGERITSLDDLAKQEFIFLKGAVKHQGFFKSMQFRYLEYEIKKGMIYKAIPKDKEQKNE